MLELPVRAQFEPGFYMRVTSTLYRYFGFVGGPLQVLAAGFAALLAWRTRSRPGFRYTAAGAACFVLSLLLWFALVQPVNVAWATALDAGTEEAVRMYDQLRDRWETGHVAAFSAWLVGFGLLLTGAMSAVSNQP